jgi:hypothetical protein
MLDVNGLFPLFISVAQIALFMISKEVLRMYSKDMEQDVEYELEFIDRMIEEGTLNRDEARYLRSTLY